MNLLSNIHSPKDIRNFDKEQLTELSREIREKIIDVVSKNGGHLASNLGVVELTIALHYVYNTPKDKIVFDVGHQAYTHKLLTGRLFKFDTLRQYKGISGFPKTNESEYDIFNTGHASTSISAALGIATARDLKGEDFKVMAVIGDGALTGGLAYEALNNAGNSKTNLLVILNSNEMSIAKNVGAISNYLNKIITSPVYNKIMNEVDNFVEKMPSVFKKAYGMAKKFEEGLKSIFIPDILFEAFGMRYFGPVDGHNLDALIPILQAIKDLKGPKLLHIITTKGHGYEFARENPERFHGTPPFFIETGSSKKKSNKLSYSAVFGKTLEKLMDNDENIVAISAAMPEGTGLAKIKEKYPCRFFDVGIAEEHAVTFAAGLARGGIKPALALYSTFLQRAFDQVYHDVCLQNLPVSFFIDRAGIVGDDGETHQGIFDIAYLRVMPNLIISAPKDEQEFQKLIYTSLKSKAPFAIRYPRGSGPGLELNDELEPVVIGEAKVLIDNSVEQIDITILAVGSTVLPAIECASELIKKGYTVAVVNTIFIKPLDTKTITGIAKRSNLVVTAEEGIIYGGFGSAISELFSLYNIKTNLKLIGVTDRIVEQGDRNIFLEKYNLTPDTMCKKIEEEYNRIKKNRINFNVMKK